MLCLYVDPFCIRYVTSDIFVTTKYGPYHLSCNFGETPFLLAVLLSQTKTFFGTGDGVSIALQPSLFWRCVLPFHSAMVGSGDPPIAKYSSFRRWSDQSGTCDSGVSIDPLPFFGGALPPSLPFGCCWIRGSSCSEILFCQALV